MDRKGRKYLVTLAKGEVFFSHGGGLAHDEIIGQDQGTWYQASHGQNLLAFKPTLSDYLVKMPRSSQIIYPKDLGYVLTKADVFPGATVVEAGLGSGTMTAALLRAVGSTGTVTTYEVRDDMVVMGMDNLKRITPDMSNHTLKRQDIYLGIDEVEVDRVILDVPEPWHVVQSAAQSLVLGGVFASFLPTTGQVQQLVQALVEDTRFQMVGTAELLERPWSVTNRSMRPAHRMVAHTGFMTTARRSYPKGKAPDALERESQDG